MLFSLPDVTELITLNVLPHLSAAFDAIQLRMSGIPHSSH